MKLLLLFMALSAALFAQNTVSDTVNISAGVHATGYIVITPNRAFTAAGGVVVGNTPVTANLDPSTGVFSVLLYANTTASPQPSFYTATFHLDGTPAFTQQWTIPTTPNPCNIQCASALNPAVIQLSQIDHSTAFAQYCIEYNGTAVLWTPCAGLGTLTGVIYATVGVPTAVTGSPTDCVKVNGTSGTCGGLGSLTGVIKATSGTPAVVAGSAGECVHVDASSAPCGGGASYQPLGSISGTLPIDGGNGTVKTIAATLTGNVTCSTPVNLSPGQIITLALTQDGTGGRTVTCGSIANLGTPKAQASQTDYKDFNAITSSTMDGGAGIWICPTCTPGINIPAPSGGGSYFFTGGAGASNVTYKFPNFGLDLTATGGTSQVLTQASLGGQITVRQLACADLTVTCLTANQTVTLSGDASGSGATSIAVVNTKVNGVSSAATPSNHTVQVVTASNTRTDKVMPDCPDTGGNHVNFTQSGDTFSCGTSGGGGGGFTPLTLGEVTVANTGSDVTIYSFASVPALPASTCYYIGSYLEVPATTTLKIFVDATQVATPVTGLGASAYSFKVALCNDAGVQNTQHISMLYAQFNTTPANPSSSQVNFQGMSPGAALTSVDLSMTHTFTIKSNSASGNTVGHTGSVSPFL